MPKAYQLKRIHGVEHKLCRGPCHRDGEWVPVNQFWKRQYRTGTVRLNAHCKRCCHVYRYYSTPPEASGWIPVGRLFFAIEELERKLGKAEASRRVGVGYGVWWKWRTLRTKKIQAAKAANLLRTLAEVRASNEVRHRLSIRRGAKARGEPERVPRYRPDYYRPQTDLETQLARERRQALT